MNKTIFWQKSMNRLMNWIKLLTWYFTSTVVIFLFVDFCVTKVIYDPMSEKRYRVSHPSYHHTLKPNFRGTGYWGMVPYDICTDEHGFKVSCRQENKSGSEFDVAFIGDSFTEAVGQSYETSFVGLFAHKYSELRVANLGVSSYSPSVYLNKVRYLLSCGIRFDHLIVFIDISDIQDEGVGYYIGADGNIRNAADENAILSEITMVDSLKGYISQNFYYLSLGLRFFKHKFVLRESVYELGRSEWTYNEYSTQYGSLGVEGSLLKAVSSMKALYDLLDPLGIKLSVGVYPWPAQVIHDDLINSRQVTVWRKFCINRCDMFVNGFHDFHALVKETSTRQVLSEQFIAGDVHFNSQGNMTLFMALDQAYSQYLKEKGSE